MRFRYKKIAVTVSLIVMGIGMITWTTRLATMDESTKVEGNKETDKPDDQQESEKTTPEVEGSTSSAIDQNENKEGAVEALNTEKGLEKNAYPEVNELITAYLNAKLSGDKEKLGELVDDDSYLDMTDVKRRTERIEEYKTIDCYTLVGPEEGAYMVYVYSEVKVKGIDTLVSSLDGFYIRTDEAGKMTITMGEIPDEVEAQLEENKQREDVVKLIQDVNRKFAEEVQNDVQLAEYYEELQKIDEPDSSDNSTGKNK